MAHADQTSATSTPPATSSATPSAVTPSPTPPTTAPSSATPSATTPVTTSSNPAKKEAADQPDLRITAELPVTGDLVNGQQFKTKVTITNAGKGVARSVRATEVSGSSLEAYGWGEFEMFLPGGTIEPGASVTLTPETKVHWRPENNTSTKFTVTTDNEANPADNSTTVTYRIVPPTTKGDIAGVLYGDRNGNRERDPGEELGGIKLIVSAASGAERFEGRTDASGRFGFPGLVAGAYSLDFQDLPDGWVLPDNPTVLVDGTERSTKVAVRAVRPETDVLTATMAFTKKSYRVGDQAQVRLTLTNKGDKTLTDIESACNRSGDGPHIGGGYEWQPLPGGKLTLKPGESRTFQPTGKVPDSAGKLGYTFAACDFGRAGTPESGRAEAATQARVPGEKGSSWGYVYHDKNGDGRREDDEGLANVKIGLIDPDTGRQVTTAVTNSTGRIEFTNIPVGGYRLHIYGPWTVAEISSGLVTVYAPPYSGNGWQAKVKPGTQLPDPAPAGDPADPEPQPAPVKKLASTGADVTGLAGIGFLVLAGGAALVFAVRRRRVTG
ncbi:MSCRAMM family protein [Crossiella sp. CA198]|uniref:MSCRAMM family protein n=1 Tax=Crossiella sp. CA198 TaxID=3455607 RepID=UPI003F8D8AE7